MDNIHAYNILTYNILLNEKNIGYVPALYFFSVFMYLWYKKNVFILSNTLLLYTNIIIE